MHSLLKSVKTAGTIITASSLFLAGVCSSNPEPSPAPAIPLVTPSEESSDITRSTTGFMGTSAPPGSIQNFTSTVIKDTAGNCVESDNPKPIIFGNEGIYGFICAMIAGDGGTAMFSTVEDPATVGQINEEAKPVESYVPYELPGKHAFDGVNKGSPFIIVIGEDNRVYQESVFANIDADAAQPLVDEVTQDFQQP